MNLLTDNPRAGAFARCLHNALTQRVYAERLRSSGTNSTSSMAAKISTQPDKPIKPIRSPSTIAPNKAANKLSDERNIAACGAVAVSYTHLTLPTNREV